MNFKLIKDFDEAYDKCFVCGKQMRLFLNLSIDQNLYPAYGKKTPYKSYNRTYENILLYKEDDLYKPFKPKNGNVKYNFAIDSNNNKIISNLELFKHVFNYQDSLRVIKECKTHINNVYCTIYNKNLIDMNYFPEIKLSNHRVEFTLKNSVNFYLNQGINRMHYSFGINGYEIDSNLLNLSKVKNKKDLFDKIETIKVFM